MTSASSLAERLKMREEGAPFQTGWSILDFHSGQRWSKQGDVSVPAASTRKIAILMTCLQHVHAGKLDLDDKILIEPRHQDNDSGIVRFLRPNLTITLYDALMLMIIVSDNAGTAAVVERVGLPAVNAFSAGLGMKGTRHVASAPSRSFFTSPTPADLTKINVTTPDDMILLLLALVEGAGDETAAARLGVTSKLCQLAIEILRNQQFRQCIPKLLPTETIVAHKTGGGPSTESDAGIVYRDGKPFYVIAVYTHHNPVAMPDGSSGRSAAREHIANISFDVWNALVKDNWSPAA
jgi:beta-lactamase class A